MDYQALTEWVEQLDYIIRNPDDDDPEQVEHAMWLATFIADEYRKELTRT
jgi:hypothetical protein